MSLKEDRAKKIDGYAISAKGHYERGEFELAIEQYTKYIESISHIDSLDKNQLNSCVAEAFNFRGICYQEQKNYALAVEDYTQAIIRSKGYNGNTLKFDEIYNSRALCYIKLEQDQLALADFNKAIQLNPCSYFVLNNRGNYYSKQEKYDLALDDFNKAVQIQPDNYAANVSRGNCHVEQKNYEIALADFNKAIELNSNAAIAYNNRAVCYVNLKEYKLASDDYETSKLKEYNKSYEAEKLDLNRILLENNQELTQLKAQLESKIKQNEALQKALHEKEKEMLSFFTHTMRNALATAPESLRQAIQLLGSEVYEKDTKHYQAINKIASLFSTLSLTDCLIDTFKQSISDPQEFKQSWQKDHSGVATPKWVIASALRQSLNRIIFMSDTTELRKLLNNPETASIKATRKSFIEEVLPLNIDSQGVDVFYGWTLTHIPAIEVAIADCDKLNFGVNQIRFSLLFAITSELILNALKYWDGESRIQISWQLEEQDNYVFSVKNHCKANATSNLAGTHKGLAFIKRLVELLGEQAQFVCKSEEQLFTAELILNKALLNGES